MLLSLIFVVLLVGAATEAITNDVPHPTAYTLPPQSYHHSVYAGLNLHEYKPEVSSAVYSYRQLGVLPPNSTCLFRLPELQKQKKLVGDTGLDASQTITQVVAVAEHHYLLAATTKGRLLKYSTKGRIELEIASNIQEPGEIHLLKTPSNDLFLYNFKGIFQVTVGAETIGLKLLKPLDSPAKVLHYRGEFVLLFPNRIQIWSEKKNSTETVSLLGLCNDLIDMDIYDGKAFLLSTRMGIAVVSLLDFRITLFSAQNAEGTFLRLRMYGPTIFVIYSYRHREYVAELFYDAEHRIDLNKFYRYLRNIQEFVFFPNFAVFMADTTVYYVRHSINRNIEFEKNSEVLHREAAFGLKTIAHYNEHDDSFVAVTQHKIAIVDVKHFSMIPVLNCEFGTAGNYSIIIEYEEASCKTGSTVTITDPRTSYCVHTVTYEFEVKPVKSDREMLLIHIALGVGITIGFVLLVLCVMYCRRIALRKQSIIERLQGRLKKKLEMQQTTIKMKVGQSEEVSHVQPDQ